MTAFIMDQKLSPQDKELWRRCDEVLHYIWDPIGVAGAPGARDEYESYLLEVFHLVMKAASIDEIAAHLNAIVAEQMGITSDFGRCRQTAKVMLDWRNWTHRN